MNHKKQYTEPQIRVREVEISGAALICTSLGVYSEEASFAGARRNSFDDDDDE